MLHFIPLRGQDYYLTGEAWAGGRKVGLGARESISLSLLKTFITSQVKPKEDTAKARLTEVCSFAAE